MNTTEKITALVLASGMGSRFGGDKLSHKIEVNGQAPLAIGVISALKVKPFVDEVICVIRPNDTALKQAYLNHGFSVVENPDFKQGLSSSIKAGINAINADTKNHYMICLADMPYIKADSYKAVTELFKARLKNKADIIVRPRLSEKNKLGHPVIFSHVFKTDLLTLKGDDGGKPLLQKYGFDSLEVNDFGVLTDIDFKADLNP